MSGRSTRSFDVPRRGYRKVSPFAWAEKCSHDIPRTWCDCCKTQKDRVEDALSIHIDNIMFNPMSESLRKALTGSLLQQNTKLPSDVIIHEILSFL